MFRIRIGGGFWTSRLGIGLLGAALLSVLALAGTTTYYYVQYSKMIDLRLSGRALQRTTQIYSGPERISEGETLNRDGLASLLQRAGYRTQAVTGGIGQYSLAPDRIEIHPAANSYFHGTNAVQVQFAGKTIKAIRALPGGEEIASAEVEPRLLTNLFDSAREKRRPVRYDDIPKTLVDAVLSAEDKRFFEHPGFDPVRILGAAWADLHKSSRLEGASTISMQVARSFFFTTERTWRRKLAETLVALQLEHRFTKKEIFELYANEIYLGNRGSFSIHGFAEASLAYFGKDIHQLTLGEAAFLAGIIRAPNHYSSADRRAERGIEARDRVLAQMVENKQIPASAAEATKKTAFHFVRGSVEASAAPYFVDMVKDHLLEKISETELLAENFRVYTTLDPELQLAASEALDIGLKNVDSLLASRYVKWRKERAKAKSTEPVPEVQVALIALDPKTGEIKALIGGRSYGQSQLNRAIARRQPGSAFKPFVYAAAFDNAVDGVAPVVTPATTVVDEPTTFEFEGQEYTPTNFGEKFLGIVTLRDALTHSLNVATVKVAEMVGYGRVVQVARQMGLGQHILATPAVALGAYEMTPLDVAAGYTVFANHGVRAEPAFLLSVVRADGTPVERFTPQTRQALDPRVAYLITSILQDVLNKGTGAGVRASGFTAPAAGKTGTSRDGWFAGFTSNLVCIVWVGFDDNRDLNLPGSAAAGPFWAEFMKRAVALPSYQNVQNFPAPDGVVTVTIDPETLQLATPNCPVTRQEVYVAGTAPTEFCERHGGGATPQLPTGAAGLSKIFGGQLKPQENPVTNPGAQPAGQPVKPPAAGNPGNAPGASKAGAKPPIP